MQYKNMFKILVFSFVFVCLAGTVDAQVNATVDVKADAGDSRTMVQSQTNMRSGNDVSSSSINSGVGGEMSSEQRNDVVSIVLKLKALAGRDRNIGEEVSAVAKEQATSSERVETAMAKIESRNAFKTFLIGSDYKNLGALRSEMVITNNSIARLTKARDRAVDASVKAELDVQIKALGAVETKIEAFVNLNESKVSLLGWFVKIFAK